MEIGGMKTDGGKEVLCRGTGITYLIWDVNGMFCVGQRM